MDHPGKLSDQAKPTLVIWLARWTGSDGPRRLLVVILRPLGRIIVEPDRRLRRAPDVDMMGEREITEAQVAEISSSGAARSASEAIARVAYKRFVPLNVAIVAAHPRPLRGVPSRHRSRSPSCTPPPGSQPAARRFKHGRARDCFPADGPYPPNLAIINLLYYPSPLGAWELYSAHAWRFRFGPRQAARWSGPGWASPPLIRALSSPAAPAGRKDRRELIASHRPVPGKGGTLLQTSELQLCSKM